MPDSSSSKTLKFLALDDKYFRTLAAIAIAKNCIQQKPPPRKLQHRNKGSITLIKAESHQVTSSTLCRSCIQCKMPGLRSTLLLFVLFTAAAAACAQDTLPIAKLTSKVAVTFDHADLEWLQYGGTINVSIVVSKNGKAKIVDVTGPMAPCSDMYSKRIASLQKTATDVLEMAAYEPAKDADGKPVESGLRLNIKVPSRKPGAAVDIPAPGTKPAMTVTGGVINGRAVSLAKPEYPIEARSAHAGGGVSVQVLIDENGKVLSAAAITGHPYLRSSAVNAACSSKFSPTLLVGNPVKVSGVITYNFVP
jgi:hypothetical protein